MMWALSINGDGRQRSQQAAGPGAARRTSRLSSGSIDCSSVRLVLAPADTAGSSRLIRLHDPLAVGVDDSGHLAGGVGGRTRSRAASTSGTAVIKALVTVTWSVGRCGIMTIVSWYRTSASACRLLDLSLSQLGGGEVLPRDNSENSVISRWSERTVRSRGRSGSSYSGWRPKDTTCAWWTRYSSDSDWRGIVRLRCDIVMLQQVSRYCTKWQTLLSGVLGPDRARRWDARLHCRGYTTGSF